MKRRKAIRLSIDEHETLATLYIAKQIPIDRYDTRPSQLQDLTNSFNSLTERSDLPEEIMHYMRTRRKDNKGKLRWPKMGRNVLPAEDYEPESVPAEHLPALVRIYMSIARAHDMGNDGFSYDPEVKQELQETFRAVTGINVLADVLLAVLRDLRKAGLLERLGDNPPPSGFDDLDEAAGL